MTRMLCAAILGAVVGSVGTLEYRLGERSAPLRADAGGRVPPTRAVQCCPMLEVPLSDQVELEQQFDPTLNPRYAPLPAPDAWRELLQGAPCR